MHGAALLAKLPPLAVSGSGSGSTNGAAGGQLGASHVSGGTRVRQACLVSTC
jgi:hypothetical protein